MLHPPLEPVVEVVVLLRVKDGQPAGPLPPVQSPHGTPGEVDPVEPALADEHPAASALVLHLPERGRVALVDGVGGVGHVAEVAVEAFPALGRAGLKMGSFVLECLSG